MKILLCLYLFVLTRYESLVGTIAKKFSGKRKRTITTEEYESSPVSMVNKRRKGFLKPSD